MKKEITHYHPVAAAIKIALCGSLLFSTSLIAQETTEAAAEQKAESAAVEKIAVIGARGAPRSVGDSAVPVDVIGGEEFSKNGTSDMVSLMTAAVPSFNVNAQPINDASTLIRPANLRGLPPDSTLVLVNGKRRHRAAVITFLGSGISDGSQGPDISVIPSIALKQVEILRDGAAAQYGSDAIAGVINFRLKDADEGGSFEVKTGQHYEGDGDLRQISGNIGLPFTDNGFANISGEYKQADPTSRSVQRSDAAGSAAAGNPFIADPAQVWGSPEFKRDAKLFANIGLEVAKDREFYLFTNWAERDVEGGFYFRHPTTRSGVYSNDEGASLLIGNLDESLGDCPSVAAMTGDNFRNHADIQADVDALPAHCFTYYGMLPGGFTPKFGGVVTDTAIASGVKGELESGWAFDASMSIGRSEVEFYIKNTLNPSLGANTPRDFKPGKYVQLEKAANLDFNKPIDVEALPYPLNVAGGVEYRDETFEIYAGDAASFEVGPLASQGFGIGSNGFPGFKPEDAGSFNRYSYAAYTELGAEFSDNFRMDFALRFEDFEDFGNTTNGKVTARYQATDEIAFRSAVSTGFRAPTVGQSHVRNVTTSFSPEGLVDTATLPPDHPISLQKGGKPLTPEKSKNFSIGTVLEVNDWYVTLDYFHIKVDDRISQTSGLKLNQADIDALLALGVNDASSFTSVKYFTNDFDTTTQGLDLVANYGFDLWDGRTTLAFAYNWTDTTVDRISEYLIDGELTTNISDAKKEQLERGLPRVRGSFTVNQNYGDWKGYVRFNHFGAFYEDHLDNGVLLEADGGIPIEVGSAITVDAEVSYSINDSYEISVGAQNLFDAYPDEHKWQGIAGSKYPTTAVMGINGGFYYVRLNYSF
ncbi:MAG: TonB-dependent receptor [Gammaproteobacteria bacterium]|nr:TonB-dependent receptor [Gammaproteobacteria bacterium]MBU2057014.1 TonB-dependent receptor [Gammaproteobacteria bacterium]MBU2173881.1 TonB-dependent receptor [Gammaproteobacteria bacterium]MBU2249010.1 TonB-dependent receptor [Gammaproteobacteria bacterium]MBU2342807.1 TonB-dependent receptor [Gammaproteobacteria bacterium]